MLKRRRDQWKFYRVVKIRNLKNFAGCEIKQVANFCKLRNFVTLLPPAVDCFLTRLFVVLYKFALHLILVHLHSFVISLY